VGVTPGFQNSLVVSGTYTIGATSVATPVFTAAGAKPVSSSLGNLYPTAQIVTIADTNKSATIYYQYAAASTTTAARALALPSADVLASGMSTGNWKIYSGPLTVKSSTTLYAFAWVSGLPLSAQSSASYTIVPTPTAVLIPVTGQTASAATLSAAIDTDGLQASYQFQYGTSAAALSSSTASAAIPPLSGTQTATVPLSGLTGKTTYYYQLVVTPASGGSVSTPVLSFTTN
jgi:hypothetical protein